MDVADRHKTLTCHNMAVQNLTPRSGAVSTIASDDDVFTDSVCILAVLY